MDNFICKKCGNECSVDGEYPKFFSWCDTCSSEPKGFDVFDYAADWMGNKIDAVYDQWKDK